MQRTLGEPVTVRQVWHWFGDEIRAAAAKHDVPAELIVATIATESAGGSRDRDSACRARREELGYQNDTATPHRVSVGCMQTLLSTARAVLQRPGLTSLALTDAQTSIDAGTGYMHAARLSTLYDPPLVAAAYNAGGVYQDTAQANRWGMRCYPLGTGEYIDRWTAWFGDAMAVSAEDPTLLAGVPSMLHALQAVA